MGGPSRAARLWGAAERVRVEIGAAYRVVSRASEAHDGLRYRWD